MTARPPRRPGDRTGPALRCGSMADEAEVARLQARVHELERRMDRVIAHLGLPELPLAAGPAPAPSDAVIELARSPKERDRAKALLVYTQESGVDLETAKHVITGLADRS